MNPPFTWQTRLNYTRCTPPQIPVYPPHTNPGVPPPHTQIPHKRLEAAFCHLSPWGEDGHWDREVGNDYFYFQTDVEMEGKRGQENFPGTVLPRVSLSMASKFFWKSWEWAQWKDSEWLVLIKWDLRENRTTSQSLLWGAGDSGNSLQAWVSLTSYEKGAAHYTYISQATWLTCSENLRKAMVCSRHLRQIYTLIHPYLMDRKLRHREVKQPAESHTANKW